MSLKVLVVGSGGREHAIAWKISQSPQLAKLYCLPGNPGTAQIATNIPAGVGDFEAIASAVSAHGIDMARHGNAQEIVRISSILRHTHEDTAQHERYDSM